VKRFASVAHTVQQQEPWEAEAMPSLLPATELGEGCPKSSSGNTKVQDTTSSRTGHLASAPKEALGNPSLWHERNINVPASPWLHRQAQGPLLATPRCVPSPQCRAAAS